ncbi:MAG: DNA polymerase alpha/epsilon subunit B-domain-containing protein [Monoraphidium minutum]|nr:MAG: DNA polymerase alpha/epsilon subunit B-domain-containing protein [Monoraphidium minutum]
MVTAAAVDAAVRQLAGVVTRRELVSVVSAFDVPRIAYDPVSKRMHPDARPRVLLATAEEKHRLYLHRYNLLLQRLRRNRRFQPPNPLQAAGGAAPQAQLTELMGLRGGGGGTCIVMGIIGSQEDGHLAIEDVGAKVPLDLSQARLASGFLTENCVVVAEGAMGRDGVFHATAVGFPSCEPRGALPATAARLDFFGAPELSAEEAAAAEVAEVERAEDRVVFLCDVWLDRPDTFERLGTIFSGYEEADAVPAMFVLTGNFTSKRASGSGTGGGGADCGADYAALRDGFASLARLVERHHKIKEGSRFVFVPGPDDPGLGGTLPQPPLPSYFSAEVQKVLPTCVFATNPCRIKYFTREVVVFRYDSLKAMRRRCLVPCEDLAQDDPAVSFAHLALTLLQQSHLCPLPLTAQPVHWAYDHALALYPLPHALVLADGSAGQEEFRHEGCCVFSPGCLHDGLFGAYAPFQDEFEASALPGAAALLDADDAAEAAAADAAEAEAAVAAEAAVDDELADAEAAAAAARGGGGEGPEGMAVDGEEEEGGGGGGGAGPCAARASGSEDEEEAGGGGGGEVDDGDDVLPSWMLQQHAAGEGESAARGTAAAGGGSE